MYKKLSMIIFVFCVACSSNSTDLTFAELEAAGFKKEQQQYFQLVGATNAWSGRWANEDIEIYTFDDPDLENAPFYKSIKVNTNDSRWADKCVHRNVVLLSNGEQACKRLYKL
ncbi:hypothetical protein [Methylophaga pinxianii]|uniref:hypothetical protein n=2 Tax=Methylophaga pinxianii TaxID=2881052 RepID=UPI001CF3B522|nr:hypothetical protein [Methylophaga pinxianii]MCB2426165.1 hypothetical protein [Methylophaga pinxianii]